MTEEQFKKLKQEVASSKAEAERAKGSLQELEKTLKREYDVSTIEEGNQLIKKLQKRLAQEEATLEELLSKYVKKWKKNQ